MVSQNYQRYKSLAAASAPLVLGISYWFRTVSRNLQEPYLDEVFHARQAEAYIDGKWLVWDPKITTPPGLYLSSYVLHYLFVQPAQRFGLFTSDPSILYSLRFINSAAGVALLVLVHEILFLITKPQVHRQKGFGEEVSHLQKSSPQEKARERRSHDLDLTHTTVNICLFPLLLFFYGLYYTDVLSVVSVLLAYRFFLQDRQNWVIFAGFSSLVFRQTNVFWVAIFLGGLQLCRIIPKGRPDIEFPSKPTFYDVMHGSWQHAAAYDPLVSEASFEDFIKSGLSFTITLLINIGTILWSLASYIILLIGFAEFVHWNGGVVLGDKENHIASIHLAQMLYIWPYFVFFSFPLLYPYILNAVLPQSSLPSAVRSGSTSHQIPRVIVAIPVLGIMLAVVHYNTIIHPFTLADNRHYMFYIFRLLLRHPLIKYLAVPVYFTCAWACITSLGGLPNTHQKSTQKARIITEPKLKLQSTITPSTPKLAPGNRVSFLLVWLLATVLSLVTAPLVEPRYFIVPWIIWRMHMSIPRRKTTEAERSPREEPWYENQDHRLWLETAWFVLINAVTGYIFLNWGFEWPQEPGRVQRFMW